MPKPPVQDKPSRKSKAKPAPTKSARDVLETLRGQQADQPKNSELVINVAEAALRCGSHEEAISAYERAIELDPRVDLRITYYQWLGYLNDAREEHTSALEAYQKWSSLDPQALEAYDRQAGLLVRLQRWTDFALLQPHYARLAETGIRGGKEAQSLYAYVLQQVGFGEEQNPLDRTYTALEFNPQSISLRYLLGMLLSRSNQLEGAEREFRRVLELDTRGDWSETRYGLDWDAQSAHLMRARLARLRGRSEEALQLLKGAGTRVGMEGVDEMAALLLENARYQELLEFLPPGEELPDWLQRAQAVALLGLGQIEAARTALHGAPPEPPAKTTKKRSAAAPTTPAWDVHLDAGEYEQVLEVTGGRRLTTSALGARCLALYSLERFVECDVAVRKFIEAQPNAIEAWNLFAAVSRQLGNLEATQLAQIQAESLKQRQAPEYPSGFVWPTSADGCLGFRFIASTRPGKAGLRLTGQAAHRFEDMAWYALNLLQPRCEAFSLEDPAYREVHLHVSALGRPPKNGGGFNEEEAGAAVFSALAAALAGSNLPAVRWALFGRLELDGRLMGPVELADSLQMLGRSQFPWEQLVLPQTAAPQLMEVRPEYWLGSQLCQIGRAHV